MTKKELSDDLFFVIKGNSGAISANDGVFTEIFDFQIPRNYCVRIRKIINEWHINKNQEDQKYFRMQSALILDPDDETSYTIPTFTIDHDVCADFTYEYWRIVENTTPNGISGMLSKVETIDFPEELDVVTVRNARFNSLVTGMLVDADYPQVRMTVYFTYEKVSSAIYEKLLGIR